MWQISVLGALLFSSSVWAQTCRLNGSPVQLDNGATTAGKTGIAVCEKDGKLWRKFEYKNGKQSGYTYITSYDGAEEFSTNDKGNKQGPAKKYSKSGQLIQSATYDNGDFVGLLQAFYDNGKPRAFSWYEKGTQSPAMEIEYNKDGAITSVRCGTKAFTDKDREICGFQNTHVVTLVESEGKTEKRTYKNGIVSEFSELSKAGKVLVHGELKDGLEHKKYFFDDGSLQSDVISKDAKKISETEYYMNGHKKSEITYKGDVKKSIRDIQEFANSGQLVRKATEVFWGYGDDYRPIGPEQKYFDSGVLKQTSNYNDSGEREGEQKEYDEKKTLREFKVYKKNVLVSAKTFDENGKLKSDRKYFADGSYKELAP